MTIHKSEAVQAGIMPDYAQAGVVLCRTCDFEAADDSIVSADTLQMVPIPKGAKVLRLEMFFSDLPDGTTAVQLGWRAKPTGFGETIDMTGVNVYVWPQSLAEAQCGNVGGGRAGFNHTFTADDTIDLAFDNMDTKLPTLTKIVMNVWYKMTGTLEDEA